MLVTKIKSLLAVSAVIGSSFLNPLPAQAATTCGYASHYGVGDGFGGLTTASGERMNPYAKTAAHRSFPLGTRLRVTRGDNSIIVRINDRGPYVGDRVLDLSYGSFASLASPSKGEIRVCYSKV